MHNCLKTPRKTHLLICQILKAFLKIEKIFKNTKYLDIRKMKNIGKTLVEFSNDGQIFLENQAVHFKKRKNS